MFLLPLCAGKLEALFKQSIHLELGVPCTLIDKEATDKEAENKEDFTYQGPGHTMSDVIHIGDNFVVNGEEGN